ncbi:DUF5372 family protein [Azohydromonas lata]|uniref:DUF5372 family protein n=1 Tax=Azohydromonas lata TaxID=45677 RepID=UPI0009FBA891|nr:DUF5372 family protein [Azohydromonas lata]
MTHPYHPLFGQQFDLVMRGQNWHEDSAFFRGREGRLRSIPANWTDLVAEDPFNVVAAGRAALRTQELLDLARLVSALQP